MRELWEDAYEKVEAECYKEAADLYVEVRKSINLPLEEDGYNNIFGNHLPLIQKYFPDYKPTFTPKRTSSSSGGCYVATSVYGSYDCPEVWTLRRFRDYILDTTWYGRLFIKTYYAISPTLVKWFGHTEWFKRMWKAPLDRMVNSLRKKGIESSPYHDKY